MTTVRSSARWSTLAVLAAVALAACVRPSHDPGVQEITAQDCYACHQSDYEGAPDHVGHNPTTCADCHSTDNWDSAGAHPEDKFPIQTGKHSGIGCSDCHVTDANWCATNPCPYTGGQNVSCVQCHGRAQADDDHQEVGNYSWQGDTRPAFCRDCHPFGRR